MKNGDKVKVKDGAPSWALLSFGNFEPFKNSFGEILTIRNVRNDPYGRNYKIADLNNGDTVNLFYLELVNPAQSSS